jgi:hypothetical protein
MHGTTVKIKFNELNPICHLLALLGAHPILHVSRIRDNVLQLRTLINSFKICNIQKDAMHIVLNIVTAS